MEYAFIYYNMLGIYLLDDGLGDDDHIGLIFAFSNLFSDWEVVCVNDSNTGYVDSIE